MADVKIQPIKESEIPVVVRLFEENKFALTKVEWYKWKYFQNPYNKALSCTLRIDNQIKGAVALLPRTYFYEGKKYTALQAVDGLIDKSVRGKGLFNMVNEFVIQNKPDHVEEPYFYITFASVTASVKAILHAGWKQLAEFNAYSFAFNLNSLKNKRLLAPFIPILNFFWGFHVTLKLKNKLQRVIIEELSPMKVNFNSYFNRAKVFGDRSPDFMNWRIAKNPQYSTTTFIFKVGEKVAGYVICKVKSRKYEIMDMFFLENPAKNLSSFLHYLKRNNKADSCSVNLPDGHDYIPVVKQCGFLFRKKIGGVFVYRAAEVGLPEDPEHWIISLIDSDW